MTDNYNDIIHLDRPVSKNHPQMPLESRAAQFAPFAALTGYDAAIQEAARLTDQQILMDEYHQQVLNDKYHQLLEQMSQQPTVTIYYFEVDTKKSGGAYQSVTGTVKSIDEYNQQLLMTDGQRIAFMTIMDMFFE